MILVSESYMCVCQLSGDDDDDDDGLCEEAGNPQHAAA